MPFDVISYVLARRKADKVHTHRRADIVDLLPIRRADLEYPTENVSLAYLMAIDKAVQDICVGTMMCVRTVDSFADRAVESFFTGVRSAFHVARWSDTGNLYMQWQNTNNSTTDHNIAKETNGNYAGLGYEAVDLNSTTPYLYRLEVVGSTLNAYRDGVVRITATDTDHASGSFAGGHEPYTVYYHEALETRLLPASTRLPGAIAIAEAEVTGSGTEDSPFKPNLKQELVEVNKLTNVPEFLKREAKRYELLKQKGFTDEEIEALLGYIPQHQVDIAAVTWGVFDHKPEHNTMLIIITGDNPYMNGAIEKQVEHAKSKNLRVLRPPRDYREAVEQYRELKKDFPEWVAGKDNYAYQTLGHEVFELFQVADTYHGNIVEGIKPNAYRNVPDWEMRRTLNMWKKRLERVNVLTEERDKHVRKIEKVLKLGW